MSNRIQGSLVRKKNDHIGSIACKGKFFGEDAKVQCTIFGYGEKPCLPKKELGELKETTSALNPKYWNSPHDFELAWTKCVESMR